MLPEPPLRQECLLLTLGLAGPFESKAMLQRTVYLAQAMSGTNQYDFKPHPYGVYSEDLGRDIDNLGMVSKSVSMPYPDYTDSHYEVRLSPGGQARLAEMGNSQMPGGLAVALPASLAKIKDMDRYGLVEKTYSTACLRPVDRDGTNNVLNGLIPKLTAFSERNDDWESDFVISALEMAGSYLEIDDKALQPQQNMVVLHLAHELVQRCSDISDALPAGKAVKPKVVELSEVELLLRGYCHDKKIKDDIFQLPFGEAFTGEEIDKLAQVVDNLDIDEICQEMKFERSNS